jgi:hypothetical protein
MPIKTKGKFFHVMLLAEDEVVFRIVLGPICRTQNIPAFAHGCPKPVMFWDFNKCR